VSLRNAAIGGDHRVASELGGDNSEALEGGGQVGDNLLGDYRGRGQARRILKRLVVDVGPNDEVEARTGREFVVGPALEVVGLDALVPTAWLVFLNEIIEVSSSQLLRLQSEVLIGAEGLDPELARRRRIGCRTWAALEENAFAFTPCA